MYLKQDVISPSKGKIRGSQGDKVKVIFTSSPAVIVEGANGERYSTTTDNLSETFIPARLIREPVQIKKAQRTKAQSKTLTQNQLF